MAAGTIVTPETSFDIFHITAATCGFRTTKAISVMFLQRRCCNAQQKRPIPFSTD
jgi:hypothetical protein